MDATSSSETTCPLCGKALPPDAVNGCCPQCLMVGAMQPTQVGEATAQSPSLTPEELSPHFPQLEIIECLGRGGMGVVYKARQKSLNRLVALKLLAPERADDPQFAARFEKEAQALAALNHPNIVAVHDFGHTGEFYFLTMEFVDGVNLRQLLQAKRLTPKEALSIVPPVCDALQCAHDHGIVHRDIKPENLLIDKAGTVKIADFGIAKIYGSPLAPREEPCAAADTTTFRTSITQPSGESPPLISRSEMATLGTPDYAAPEQANGTADHRADIYSLGVVLYEMLTGERPKDKIEAPSKRVQVDVRIDEIVLRALEREPELRFHTAAEFRTQVEAAVSEPRDRRAESQIPASGIEPRFSRTALWAAAWITLSVFVVPPFLWHEAKTHEFEHGGPFGNLLGALIFFVFLLPAFTAPLGATLLGWISVTQIRRSAGKLYGLGLAVFDGLFFPLLALDVLIFSIDLRGRSHLAGPGLTPGVSMVEQNIPGSVVVLLLAIIAVVDFLIIRAVWRVVNKPLNATPKLETESPRRKGLVFASVAASILVFGFFFTCFGVKYYDWRWGGKEWHSIPIQWVGDSPKDAAGVLRIAEVKREGRAVIFRIACESGRMPVNFQVSYSGQELESLPSADAVPSMTPLYAPTATSTPKLTYAGKTLVGANWEQRMGKITLAKPGEFTLGFVLPDEARAEMAMKQARDMYPPGRQFRPTKSTTLVLFLQQRNARETNWEQLQAALMVDFIGAPSQPDSPLLRVTVRVLDVPGTFDDAQLLRPSGLLDSSEVKILAAPYAVVPSGSEGEIQIKEVTGMENSFSPVLSGRTKTLYVKPALKPGSALVDYQLDGQMQESAADAKKSQRQSLRSDSLRLGELQIMESSSLPNGRRQLAVISAEMEVMKVDAAGKVVPSGAKAATPVLSFGPVIEREVNGTMDFDSGKVVPFDSIPESLIKSDDIAEGVLKAYAWMEHEGMDAIPEPSHSLKGVGLKAKAMETSAWEQCSPEQTSAALAAIQREPWQDLDPRHGDEPRKAPATWVFETREGGQGILQVLDETDAGVKIRYKLVRHDSATTTPPPSPAALVEQPKLPFLAWQDVWKEREPGTAFHADGSPTTDAEEVRLQQHLQPIRCSTGGTDKDGRAPRFLHLWFSHPLFDPQSLNEVALLDNTGKPVEPRDGMLGSRACGPEDGDRLGWLMHTLSPGFGHATPSAVTIRLRYTLGPLEKERQVEADESGVMSVGNGSQLNGVGQNAEGKAFLALAVNMEKDADIQFGVVAVTKDGRELQPSGRTSGGSTGGGVHIQRFTFDTSLSNVAHFRLGTRPVRTVEFHNVHLPIAAKAAVPVFGSTMEAVLPGSSPDFSYVLQFRSGRLFQYGRGPDTSREQFEADAKIIKDAGGGDVQVSVTAKGGHLDGEGCVFLPRWGKPAWDDATPADVSDWLAHQVLSGELEIRSREDLPVTAFFKTARGETGILQVFDIVKDERGFKGHALKLRYKLVQTGSEPSAKTSDNAALAPDLERMRDRGLSLVSLLFDHKYASAVAEFDERLRAAMPEARLAAFWEHDFLSANAEGNFKGADYGAARAVKEATGYRCIVPFRWDKKTVGGTVETTANLEIHFNDSGEVTRITSAPHQRTLTFGPVVNGLQAALELRGAEDGSYTLGQPIEVRFHIRNTSKDHVHIADESWRQVNARDVTIKDANGQKLEVAGIFYTGIAKIQRVYLQPGESTIFHSGALEFLPEKADAAEAKHPVVNYVKAKPGRYTVSYHLRFPQVVEAQDNDGDWKGELDTAPVTIEVKAADAQSAATKIADVPRASVLQFRWAANAASEQTEELTLQDGSGFAQKLQVEKAVLLDGSAVQSADAAADEGAPDRWSITVILTKDGAERFAKITGEGKGRRLAIMVDGKLVAAPTIMMPIAGGSVSITGNFTEQQARELAEQIRASQGSPRTPPGNLPP